MRVVLEAGVLDQEHAETTWKRMGSVGLGDRPGSITTEGPDGRQVYLFGWLHGRVGVWRSVAGYDAKFEDLLLVSSAGIELVGDLSTPVEMVWTKLLFPERVPVRFRLEA